MAGEETPSELLTGSLFDRIKEFFSNMWTAFWEIDPQILIPFWGNIGSALSEKVEERMAAHMVEALVKQVDVLSLPEEIKATIKNVTKDKDFASLLLGYLVTFSYYTSYIGGHSAVAAELSSHEWRKKYLPTLPDTASLILAMYRDETKRPMVIDMLHKQGYTDQNIDTLFAASKSIPAPDEMRSLFLRGEIDEATLNANMKKYGFTDTEIMLLKKLFYPIPSYQDLIRMAVREAFYPDYVEEYGLMQELPGEYLEWTQKQGLSEDWAKKYWASHWELPSILRGYEMLHRGVITEEQLDDLFMAADIMPWWRDKLRAISYHPLTRVDVRRVFRMGIIDRDQVNRTYHDLGYDDEKAEWLTRFTEMQNTEQDRDLTKSEILGAYVKQIIGYSECHTMLIDLGYSEDEVGILISAKEYQEYKEYKAREMKRIERFFLAGAYTANQTINELGKLDLTGAEQDSIMRLWDSEKLAKLRSPTKKDLDSLFTADIITEAQYRAEIHNLGYIEKYIDWFVTALKAKVEE